MMADKENKSEIVTENPTEKREKKKAKKPKFFLLDSLRERQLQPGSS